MNLLIVGTVAYDSVKTPFGARERILGGSAAYCATSASYFTDAGILAVVGEDFEEADRRLLEERGVDLAGLTTLPGQKCFHWKGEYGFDLNEARTLRTDLNVLTAFDPVVPDAWREVPYVFLANMDPKAQAKVLDQVEAPRLVAADTMNYWIENAREDLQALLPRIDILVINEAESRQLSGEANLLKAARKILTWGPRSLIVKRGEYGVLAVSAEALFAAPGYPLENVFDPTGAGDSFAGGFMGRLASNGTADADAIRQAIILGSVMASFNVEDFSMTRLAALSWPEIAERYQAFRRLTRFEDL
ncbi:MAG: PfkB family carbohydrate kinase [Acidobacteriota bacterium]